MLCYIWEFCIFANVIVGDSKKSTGTQPSCRGGYLLNYTLLDPSSSPVGKYRQGRGKISILGSFVKKDLPIQLHCLDDLMEHEYL